MNWKTSIIFSVSFLAAFFGEVIYTFSCSDSGDPYDYYVSFMNPNLAEDKGYTPFYYTALSQYYLDDNDEKTANVSEWQQFFKTASPKDIQEFVYSYSRPQMTAIYNHIEKGDALQVPDSVRHNTVTRALISNKDRETLGYLMYAKQCEPHVLAEDLWTARKPNVAQMTRLQRNGLQLLNVCKDPQIKERFAYQAIRMAHFSNDYPRTIQLYDSLLSGSTTTGYIHYKSLALKAGALFRTGRKTESAYYFSQVFQAVPSLRQMAFLNAGWTAAPITTVLRLCRNNNEKATVAGMYAFRHSEAYPDGLRQVYALDPQSPMLDVLLLREVNKIEDGYLDRTINQGLVRPTTNYNWYYDRPQKNEWVNHIQKVTDSIGNIGKVKDAALWKISSAYISYMLKDYAGARKRLEALPPTSLKPAYRDQWEIVRLLVAVNQQQSITPAFEAELLQSFKWLDSKIKRDANGKPARPGYYYEGVDPAGFYFNRIYRNLLDFIIANRYAQLGDMPHKALVLSRKDEISGEYTSVTTGNAKEFVREKMQPAELIALYELKQSKRQSALEKYLFSYFPMDNADLSTAIGTSFLRVQDFIHAQEWFKKAPGETQQSAYQIFDPLYQDFGSAMDSSGPIINQQAFAAEMISLEKTFATGKATARQYQKYANGLFSISYYGPNWHFVTGYRSSTQWYSPERDSVPTEKEYYGVYKAEEYYKKAAEATTDKELKAECLFLAARCAQKHIPVEPNADDPAYISKLKKNIHFPALNQFSQTQFFQARVEECSYLQDYVRVNKGTDK